ncbi:MAG: hypothetical protein NTW21_15840 [Verrucomicrobia bacterium]|nr:hypothetical protein [Verrucomicrobiota bacterium]
MKPFILTLVTALLSTLAASRVAADPPTVAPAAAAKQFIVLNTSGQADSAALFEAVRREFPATRQAATRVGIAGIFSYLRESPDKVRASLAAFLRLAADHDLPVVVQLDGEQWWEGRPDLWNWWDQNGPGYNPANRANVEWSGWGPEHAVRIAWRNWGQQIRVLPPPNLMSPAYRAACHREMAALIPIILQWWHALPPARRELLVGIKLGWESSVGVNAWYYPDGNALAERPASDDPKTGLRNDELPARGVAPIGYAAVTQARLRTSGMLTEHDLAVIAWRHLEDLCREAARLGVPRDRLFTHGAGWQDDEQLYQAAVNRYSCPGWSCYRHANDPAKDTGMRTALARSDAPWWAAVEWLCNGTTVEPWRTALTNTLADPRCRFLTIFNWEGIQHNPAALQAIREVCARP